MWVSEIEVFPQTHGLQKGSSITYYIQYRMLEFQISTKKELRVTKNRNKERTLLSVEDIVDIKTSKLVEYFYTSLLEPKWWHAGRHDLFGEWENEGFVVSFMHLDTGGEIRKRTRK